MRYRKFFTAKTLTASFAVAGSAQVGANDRSAAIENSADRGVYVTRVTSSPTVCATVIPSFAFYDQWQRIYGESSGFWLELGDTTCDTKYPGGHHTVFAWNRPDTNGYYEDSADYAPPPAVGSSAVWKIAFVGVMPNGLHRWQGYVGSTQVFDQGIPATWRGVPSQTALNSAQVGIEVAPSVSGFTVPQTWAYDLRSIDANGNVAPWSGRDKCFVENRTRGTRGNWGADNLWVSEVRIPGGSACPSS